MLRLPPLLLLASLLTPVFATDVGVRVRFGLKDTGDTVWDGKASVSPGTIEHIDGWRFQGSDRVLTTNSWQASTRILSVRRTNAAKKGAKGKKGGGGLAMA